MKTQGCDEMATPKVQRKRDAIRHVVDTLGSDMFTTDEVWASGRRMLASGQPWPAYLKRAFARISSKTQLGTAMARHPDFGRVDGGDHDGRLTMGSGIDRVRTAMWRLR